MGSDLSIVNAARVSFNKRSQWVGNTLSDRDVKLINFLAREGHWSPFAHTALQLHIKAPLFVARQLQKHQIGGVWNEVSRRYVDHEPEFYWPINWRGRPIDKKQGSSHLVLNQLEFHPGDGPVEVTEFLKQEAKRTLRHYEKLIKSGIAPEQARMILPQNMYTEWFWSGSIYFFARVARLRLSKDAQEETQDVVREIAKHCEINFPVSWEALNVKGRIEATSDEYL
jgi:thymidylate synthase (FAD)